jgi:high-affinity Fe2+/Pb2+ permease
VISNAVHLLRTGFASDEGQNVASLMIYATVFFTIISAMMIGIAAGYVTILGILYAFGRRRQAISPPPTTKIARVEA